MVVGLEHTEQAYTMLTASGIRIAELGDIDGKGIDIVVGSSHREAGRASARHLLARSYRRIGYAGNDIRPDHRARKRFEGFRAVLAENGMELEDQEMIEAPSSILGGRDALLRLLARSPGIDAVYFANDDMAIGGYFHCLSRGIAIPSQLALFGYNGP
jgi:LacI family gluconate utilization system Gnt-I transcriptional repressor